MPTVTPPPNEKPLKTENHSGAWQAILWGGMVAGTLDLAFALLYYFARGGKLVRVLQSIAAGFGGKEMYSGGVKTAALGVGLHFLIATLAAAVFWLIFSRVRWLWRRTMASGLLFGAAVYYVMNLVVLPLSALKTKGYPLAFDPWMIGAHVFLVGLPIALIARQYVRAG